MPVVLATNRDEYKRRPSSPARLWSSQGFVAPRDDQSLGTWLGVSRRGLYAAVTNRFPAQSVPHRESRGLLVVEALQATSLQALHHALGSLSPRRFNPFHLLYGNHQAAAVTWSDGAQVFQQHLADGLHVITERSFGGDERARVDLVRASWPALPPDAPPDVSSLQRVLALARPDDPFGGVCIDVPELDYGTRSSMILLLAPEIERSRWWWRDGPPDQAQWLEHPELLQGLRPSDLPPEQDPLEQGR